jgi:hypothetical protein
MKDPEGVHDTEPSARAVASAEDTDPAGSEGTDTSDTSPDPLDADRSEQDTPDFLRWLPTMWLGYRRRKELVHRRSSDGADFVAYASAARPVAASSHVRPEATVQVRSAPSTGSMALVARNARASSEAAEREAATVLLRRRIVGPRGALVACAAVAIVSVGVGVCWWAEWPLAKEGGPGSSVAVAPPMAIASSLPKGKQPLESPAVPPPTGLHETAQEVATSTENTSTDRRATIAMPSLKESRHKIGRTDAVPAAADASARSRATLLPTASAVPAKEQYFEAQ